jgi:chromosomal replication initiation ATPase DnaA
MGAPFTISDYTPPPLPRFGAALIARLAARAEGVLSLRPGILKSRDRRQTISYARFAVMKVAKEHKRSSVVIGQALGGLDHSSVLYGIKRADELAAEMEDYRALIAVLRWEAEQ